jgi:hypothetical protein
MPCARHDQIAKPSSIDAGRAKLAEIVRPREKTAPLTPTS